MLHAVHDAADVEFLWTVFILCSNERETWTHIVRLPFPICETRLISTRVSLLFLPYGLEV
jgi:hypothetical protein